MTRQPLSTPDARNPHPWGVTYAGSADLETVIDAIETVCRSAGLVSKRVAPDPGILRLDSVQTRPWYRVLATALPQRIEWHLTTHHHLTATADFKIFRWYSVLLVVLAILVAAGLASSLLAFELAADSARDEVGRTMAPVFLGSIFLSLAVVLLLGALGGGRQVAALWQPIAHRVAQHGGRLEPVGRTVSRRYATSMTVAAILWLSIAGWPAWTGLREMRPLSHPELWGPLLLLPFVFSVLLIAYRRRDFMLRSEALLGGLTSAFAMAFFLSLPLPLLASSTAVAVLEASMPSPELRQWCWVMLAFSATIGVFAIGSLLHGVRLCLGAWLALWRMQRRGEGIEKASEGNALDEAVGGPSVLRLVHRLLVPFWLLAAGVLSASLARIVVAAGQVVFPSLAAGGARLPELSASVVALALGRPPDDPATASAVGAGWVLYAALGLGLWLASVGQLFYEQRCMRRNLRHAAVREHPRRDELTQAVDAMRRRADLGPVSLAISETEALEIWVTVFGPAGSERFVVVSEGCLERFGHREIEALLGHELAHLLEGHCRRDQLMRWLGRLTFMGDGFVLALQNSWNYEIRADRTAVRRLGVSAEVLLKALRRIRRLQTISRFAAQSGSKQSRLSALSRKPEEITELLDRGAVALAPVRRWRLAWQIFLRQYVDAMALYYWHPGRHDRERSLCS